MRAAIVPVVLALAVVACGAEERSAERSASPPREPPADARPLPADKPPPAPLPLPATPPSKADPTPPSETRSDGTACSFGTVRAVGDHTVTLAGVAKRSFVAYRRPGRERLARFDTLNANGHVTVVQIRGLVKDDCGMLWYYAALPMRPNGIAGFVAARDVVVQRRSTKITIDLSGRELVLYRDGEEVLRSPVAVGEPETPTPTGRYYVNQRLIAPDPGGPWGPGALGISAFSDVLQEWIQGGPIGIHGTNDPSSIGRAASHGCVRLPNDVLMKVFNAADAGTPVIIQA